jgi:hypothetical protein
MKLLLTVLLLATLTPAQQKPAAEPAPQIDQLLWMVGDWQTTEKSDAGDLLVHLSAHKSENQQAILYYVWFEKDGKITPQYNGMYYWHPGEKTFKVLQVDSHGAVGEGTYEQTGNRVTQLVKTVSDKGSMELKSEWEIRPREFHFVAQFRTEGKTDWAPALDITYTRMESKK